MKSLLPPGSLPGPEKVTSQLQWTYGKFVVASKYSKFHHKKVSSSIKWPKNLNSNAFRVNWNKCQIMVLRACAMCRTEERELQYLLWDKYNYYWSWDFYLSNRMQTINERKSEMPRSVMNNAEYRNYLCYNFFFFQILPEQVVLK